MVLIKIYFKFIYSNYFYVLQFMGPRFPGGPRPNVRMAQMGGDFSGVSQHN